MVRPKQKSEAAINVVDEAPESHDDAFWDTKQPGQLDTQDTAFPTVTDNDNPDGADPWAWRRKRSGERRVARTLWHGTSDTAAEQIMADGGLMPQIGPWVENSYGQDYDFEGEDADRDWEVTFATDRTDMGKALGGIIAGVAHKLGKDFHNVTDQDIRVHGALLKIEEGDDYMEQRPRGDPQYHPEVAEWERRQYEEGLSPAIEPGDWYSRQSVGVDAVLTGQKMLSMLRRGRVWPRTWGPDFIAKQRRRGSRLQVDEETLADARALLTAAREQLKAGEGSLIKTTSRGQRYAQGFLELRTPYSLRTPLIEVVMYDFKHPSKGGDWKAGWNTVTLWDVHDYGTWGTFRHELAHAVQSLIQRDKGLPGPAGAPPGQRYVDEDADQAREWQEQDVEFYPILESLIQEYRDYASVMESAGRKADPRRFIDSHRVFDDTRFDMKDPRKKRKLLTEFMRHTAARHVDAKVYHGSFDLFSTANPEYGELGFHVGSLGQAVNRLRDLTTVDRETGEDISYKDPPEEAYIYQYEVDPNKLYRMDDMRVWRGDRLIAHFKDLLPPPDYDLSDTFEEWEEYDTYLQLADEDADRPERPDDSLVHAWVREGLKALGYDGIVYRNRYERGFGGFKQDSYILFDHVTPVKTVELDTGTWDTPEELAGLPHETHDPDIEQPIEEEEVERVASRDMRRLQQLEEAALQAYERGDFQRAEDLDAEHAELVESLGQADEEDETLYDLDPAQVALREMATLYEAFLTGGLYNGRTDLTEEELVEHLQGIAHDQFNRDDIPAADLIDAARDAYTRVKSLRDRRSASPQGWELGDLTDDQDDHTDQSVPRKIDDAFRWSESYHSENQYEDPSLKLGAVKQAQRVPELEPLPERAPVEPVACVDLDGTLLQPVNYDLPQEPSGQPKLMPPNRGASGAMGALKDLGWKVIIHTARFSKARSRQQAQHMLQELEDHLQRYDIHFDEVALGPKPIAQVYIDDKAKTFDGDWWAVVKDVTKQAYIKPDKQAGDSVAYMVPVPLEWPNVDDNGPAHMTLAYVQNGPFDADDYAKFSEIADEVGSRHAPFDLEFEPGVAWFENADGESIAHKRPAQGLEQLTALANDLRDALQAAGYEVGFADEPFKAHATLAYCDGRRYDGEVPEGGFRVDDFEIWGFEDEGRATQLSREAAGLGLNLEGNPNDWTDPTEMRNDLSVNPYGGRSQLLLEAE